MARIKFPRGDVNLSLVSDPEFRSKLIDGLLAFGTLVILVFVTALLRRPFQSYGMPGLLIYTLAMLALAYTCLELSVNGRVHEYARAWYGMVGGLFAWTALETSSFIGLQLIAQLEGLLFLIMLGLFAAILWRHGLPIGAKFWLQTFLMSWTGHFILVTQQFLSPYTRIIDITYPLTGYLSITAALGVLIWIFSRSRTPISRLWGAVWMWFLVVIALYVFRGGIA